MPAPLAPADLYRIRFADHVRLNPSSAYVAFALGWADEATCRNQRRVVVARVDDGSTVFESDGYLRAWSPEWSPDGEQLAFLGETADGACDLCLVRPETAEVIRLAALDGAASLPSWSPTGERIAVLLESIVDPEAVVESSNPAVAGDGPVARVVRHLDYRRDDRGYIDGRGDRLAVIDRANGDVRVITPSGWRVSGHSWAPDGERLAFVGSDDPDADLAELGVLGMVDLQGGVTRVASGRSIRAPAWSPGGDRIAYLAAGGAVLGSFDRVWAVAVSDGAPRCLTADLDRNAANTVMTDLWSPPAERLQWTPDAEAVLFLASGPGAADVWRVALEGRTDRCLPARERSIYGFDARGQTIAFCATSPLRPSEVFVSDGTDARAVTDLNPWLGERAVAAPRRLTFAARDGVEVEGWLLRPPAAEADVAGPLVLHIHGGPFMQYGWAFYLEMQVLAGRGYQVLYTNPRASDGYGERFRRQRFGLDFTETVYGDLMSAVDHVVARIGGVDESRLGVTGGSFGGYMTNFTVSTTTRFSAAVANRSVSDTLSEIGTSDGTSRTLLRFTGSPWQDGEALRARSPVTRADRIRTPLLLMHGEMDFNATIGQSEQLFGALRLLGRTVELVRFPGESHELPRSGRPDRRVEYFERVAGWFDRHLA